MKVYIIGPNLRDQSKGQYHVHAVGCADTKKAIYAPNRLDLDDPVDITSQQEAVEYVFADFLDEYPWEDLQSDLYFFPCTDALPNATSKEA